MRNSTQNWQLVIAGPDENRHAREIEAKIVEQTQKDRISFIGPQFNEAVWKCYAAAELFVLPSFSEGFSMAVLEALALGTPVCISTECHFPEVESFGCGLIFEPTLEALVGTLNAFLEISPNIRKNMGELGRELVEGRFIWREINIQFLELYSWLRDKTLRQPKFVILEDA